MDTLAFVLQSIDYKDNHKILYTYTKDGQQSILAYNVKKLKNRSRYLSQRGNLIQYSSPKKELASLKDGQLVNEYENIKLDPIKYATQLHILELVRHVIDDASNHEKMFNFLSKIFDLMNQGFDEETLAFIFELKLLYFVGYGLNFKACSICFKTEDLVFHVNSGGLICKDHIKDLSRSYQGDVIDDLKRLYFIDILTDSFPLIEGHKKHLIRQIIDELYEEFISYHTKSSQILKQLKKN